ncbi:MAG: alpha/beta hydrolase [Chitinophagales bacterium]|nr:alpha/beta hydrolase [Chitinophagales bacterium]
MRKIAFYLIAIAFLLQSCTALQQATKPKPGPKPGPKPQTQQPTNTNNNANTGPKEYPTGLKTGNVTYNTPVKPNGTRYKDPIYNSVNKTMYVYEESALQQDGSRDNLEMTVYQPEGDVTKNRPCIIYVYGGGFFTKVSDGMNELGTGFAKKGFVGVCIEEYRMGYPGGTVNLTKCIGTPKEFEPAVYRAIQDIRAAIRYVKDNADKLGIDKNKIFLGGQSAGGFISVGAAYLEQDEVNAKMSGTNGSIDASSNSSNDAKVAGVFTFAGGSIWPETVDNTNIPTIFFHGSCDNFVAPEVGTMFGCAKTGTYPTTYGGKYLFDQLNKKGAPVQYVNICNAGHDLPTWNFTQVLDRVTQFAYDVMNNTLQKGKTETQQAKTPKCPGQNCNLIITD